VVDTLLVMGAFLLPTGGVLLYIILREIGRLRRGRRASQALAEAEAAEGYPPPGPPTTDSLADEDVN
jgi:hypothetical protein